MRCAINDLDRYQSMTEVEEARVCPSLAEYTYSEPNGTRLLQDVGDKGARIVDPCAGDTKAM
jgi:hypothetical protein